jgi:hypothetical protein
MFEIDGVDVDVIVKPFNGNNKIMSTMIVPKKTVKSIKDKKGEAEIMNYEEAREFVETHRKQLMKNKGHRYQINVFTMQGWRTNKQFFMDDAELEWFDGKKQYGGKELADDNDVFAIQILDWGKI